MKSEQKVSYDYVSELAASSSQNTCQTAPHLQEFLDFHRCCLTKRSDKN